MDDIRLELFKPGVWYGAGLMATVNPTDGSFSSLLYRKGLISFWKLVNKDSPIAIRLDVARKYESNRLNEPKIKGTLPSSFDIRQFNLQVESSIYLLVPKNQTRQTPPKSTIMRSEKSIKNEELGLETDKIRKEIETELERKFELKAQELRNKYLSKEEIEAEDAQLEEERVQKELKSKLNKLSKEDSELKKLRDGYKNELLEIQVKINRIEERLSEISIIFENNDSIVIELYSTELQKIREQVDKHTLDEFIQELVNFSIFGSISTSFYKRFPKLYNKIVDNEFGCEKLKSLIILEEDTKAQVADIKEQLKLNLNY